MTGVAVDRVLCEIKAYSRHPVMAGVLRQAAPTRRQMMTNTFSTSSRQVKASFIASLVLVGICILVSLVILIGRVPISGHIAVSQDQSERFGQIMKENGIIFWTGIGGMGMMGVQFDNPLALSTIHDLIIDDARRNKYKAIVRYRCLIPYFDHSVIVN